MHTYQSVPNHKSDQNSVAEMNLSNGRVFWNLSKNFINNQIPNVVIKLNTVSYSSKSGEKSESPKSSRPKQNLLPYPVLPLQETLQRFLLSAQPLLTAKEFEQQQKITKKFEENEGDALQKLLEEAGKKEKNWLAHRWQKAAYLRYRDPVTVFISPGMTFPVAEFKNKQQFLDYTAKAIYGLMEFKSVIDAGKIPVVKMGKDELDNSQFEKVFGTCRIPKHPEDEIVYNPSTNYAVIIYKNHFYKLLLVDANNKMLASCALFEQLDYIMNCESDFGIPFGILTTDSRGNWAAAYEHLMKNPQNRETVKIIQGAQFIVSLDECVPIKPGEQLEQLILGLIHGSRVNTANRWMDKTIQLVINPNGNVGFTYEHSPAEGQPIAMLMDYVVKKMAEDENYGSKGSKEVISKPCKISFAPPDPCLDQWLFYAKRNVDKLITDLQMKVIKFECYGKDYIKTKRLGPDSYIQMALQLAFYKMHNEPTAQYESAHLRIFDGGRTETIRSCTNESLAFCRAMTNEKATVEERIKALRTAVGAHQILTKLAVTGKGVDRHLLGLKLMAQENNLPIPEFYSSLGFTKSQHYRVSTSQVASQYEAFMCYGPATDDGYAICYNPRGKDIILAISAWKYNMETNPEAMSKEIEKTLLQMLDLLEQEKQPEAKSKL